MTLPTVAILISLAVAAGLSIGMYQFLDFRAGCRARETGLRGDVDRLAGIVQALTERVSCLEREIAEVPSVQTREISGGMNLNRRCQALRLMRQGEVPDRIATALKLPRKEVELLEKVNRIVIDRIAQPTS